jgi:hypothetical protein
MGFHIYKVSLDSYISEISRCTKIVFGPSGWEIELSLLALIWFVNGWSIFYLDCWSQQLVPIRGSFLCVVTSASWFLGADVIFRSRYRWTVISFLRDMQPSSRLCAVERAAAPKRRFLCCMRDYFTSLVSGPVERTPRGMDGAAGV